MPTDLSQVYPILNQMHRRGEIRPIMQLPRIRLYEMTVPYAPSRPLVEEELLMELHPYAAIGYLSALAFHSLTEEMPKEIIAMIPKAGAADMIPLDTATEDWEGITRVRGSAVRTILNRTIRWVRVEAPDYFGLKEYRPHGYPLRVATPERTLLDGLQRPDLCGGFSNVLTAWATARDLINLDALVHYVDLFNVNLLRQRTGFILDELGLYHPQVERWKAHALRGGSSKLLSSAPYEPTYSERWNLSINAPVDVLRER